MRHIRSLVCVTSLLSAVVVVSAGSAAAQRSAGAPIGDGVATTVDAISATSPDDVWAVGAQVGESASAYTQHWDGTAWTAVATPQRTRESFLSAVAAVSPTDAWAVGFSYGTLQKTLAMHWDGTAWTIVPTPSPRQEYCHLDSVTAAPGGSVWAVGNCDVSETPIVERWDGSAWHIVYKPLLDAIMTSLSASSDSDVWAVGYENQHGGPTLAVALHWDGSSWAQVRMPRPGRYNVFGVSAVAPGDVWAVGTSWQPPAIAENWNGERWRATKVPGRHGRESHNDLSAVSLDSPSDGWAVGYWQGQYPATGPLIEHWDGSGWSTVHGPAHDSHGLPIGWNAVVSTSPTSAWAVGSTYDNGEHGVVGHWDGTAWTLSWSDPAS
jgi:hypothetical protein